MGTAVRRLDIDPVTRIEGHGKITVHLDERGRVVDARFHVTQFRGFEKFTTGRPFTEMPALTARTCGICPVSHLIASAKACDAILAVEVPAAAVLLRKALNLAQLLQSHALSFFYLSAPDFLLGLDAPPEQRNLFAMVEANPGLARDGVALRRFGQEIIERLAGKRIHPAWVVPGGVAEPLSRETRDWVLEHVPDAQAAVRRAIDWFKRAVADHPEEVRAFANFPSLFVGLVGEHGELEHYDGKLRVVDATGRVIADGLEPSRYAEFIAERVEPDSFLKSPYFAPLGEEDGLYRVGPLARLNVVDRCGTPQADQEWAEFRGLERGACLSSFHYHTARLVEMLYALEKIEELLGDPAALSARVRAQAGVNRLEGVGVAEAPRGTLIHHYRVDDAGLVQSANMIIATGHNNLAMNKGVLQVARRFVDGERLQEGMLNRVEAVIRAFDPCLSCSTHALGQMPLEVRLVDAGGRVVDTARSPA